MQKFFSFNLIAGATNDTGDTLRVGFLPLKNVIEPKEFSRGDDHQAHFVFLRKHSLLIFLMHQLETVAKFAKFVLFCLIVGPIPRE